MALPISITYTFSTATGIIPLSQLDTNFSLITNTINGIGDGTTALTTPALGTPTSGTLTNCTGYTAANLSGTLATTKGGTNLTSYSTGDIIYASASNTLSTLTVGSTNQVLTVSAGGIPSWTTLTGGTGTVTTVSVVSANGFTGTVATATTTPAITLTTSITGVLKGNGTAISAATAGTDYVAPGGALGTPSSGTVTNLTGTASININGTVGATTPTTGAFTTLSASSTVSGTGFSTYLASPPAIGGTAAAAGTFTQLTVNGSNLNTAISPTGTGTVTISPAGALTINPTAASTINNASIGATTASTGKFTTLEMTSVTDTSSIARNTGLTANTTVTNQATFTTAGVTLPSQTATAGASWRIRAFGTFVAASSATVRTAQISCFWGTTQLVAITPTVLASTAQTTGWQVEFILTGTSTTAIWTTGVLNNRIASATLIDNTTTTAASTTVTSGAQTLDLRVRVSTAVAAESWVIQQVTIERLE